MANNEHVLNIFEDGDTLFAEPLNENFQYCLDETKNRISDLQEEWDVMEQELQEIVDVGMNQFLKRNQLSNVITEIPQRINYEFQANGELTLKSGSEVFVNNGNGYESMVLTTDAGGAGQLWTDDNTRTLLAVYIPATNTLVSHAWDYVYHSSNAPTTFLDGCALWDDTSNNQLKSTIDSGVTWQVCSLPIMSGRAGGDNIGWHGYIDEVFNGWGFFGQKSFVLPGVKCLFADGYNSDGTFKNYEKINTAVNIKYIVGVESPAQIFFIGPDGDNLGLFSFYNSQYSKGRTGSLDLSGADTGYVVYNTTDNAVYYTLDNGTTWNFVHHIYLGQAYKAANANISYMKSEKPNIVSLLTSFDLPQESHNGLKGSCKFASGLLIQWGYLEPISAGTRTVNFRQPYTTLNYIVVTAIDYGTSSGNAMSLGYYSGAASLSNRRTTGFDSIGTADGNNIGKYWFAIGY